MKITKLIQVVYDISNQATFEREIKGLVDGSKETSCDELLIISWYTEGTEKYNGKEIKIIPFWNFLLETYNISE
ncbi:MAG: hypothetical protein ACPL25_00715 [Ignavibacteria bacterium]